MRRYLISLAPLICILLLLGDIRNSSTARAGSFNLYIPLVSKPKENNWSMAGANPERTSWTPEEVRGKLKPIWYRPIEPYISQKVQVIAANDTLYISTAKGLYAFDAETGAEKWVYPTELPLGHSPTVSNGVVYVGGFDKKIHAIDAYTGKGIWTFTAQAGFQTNPLVVNNVVFMGNRDGYLYAVDAKTGSLVWRYKTGGPILFSAAYEDGNVYFASNDSYAYALKAIDGSLIWKSDKLPGSGFHSWWPVIYKNRIIFSASRNYRRVRPGKETLETGDILFPSRKADPAGILIGPLGEESGDWVPGTPTIDTSRAEFTPNGQTMPLTEFLEQYPWRRTIFILDLDTGQEVSYDFDLDGKPEYAPIMTEADKGNQFYPPIVGGDNVLYIQNMYMSSPSIPGGQISGWKMDTSFISVISSDWGATDEPHAAAAGGNLIYWSLCCDRQAGSIDLSIPDAQFANRYKAGKLPPTGGGGSGGENSYFIYNLPELIPGYNMMTYVSPENYYSTNGGVYGGRNGVYGWHHDGDPPIPYKGKVYLLASNALVAFAPNANQPTALPLAKIMDVQESEIPVMSVEEIKTLLNSEIQKILEAGHLRPGYAPGPGIFDLRGSINCGEDLVDYWHNPAETIYTLIRTLPYLPDDLRQEVKAYLQGEFDAYPPYQYNHIGWEDGAPREIFGLPEDVVPEFADYPAENQTSGFAGWASNPFAFYGLWMYAEEFGNAVQIFNLAKNSKLMDSLITIPADDVLQEMPFVHNAYVAGYIGYIELAQLANSAEDLIDKQIILDQLLSKRAANFSKEAPDKYFEGGSAQDFYCRSLNVSRNFMFLVPELAQYLRVNAMSKVQEAVDEYQRIAPFWFVSAPEEAFGEGGRQHLYDYLAIFQAKAFILQESYEELAKYLDVPAVAVGDLFYIQNLVSTIEAAPAPISTSEVDSIQSTHSLCDK